MYESPDLEAHTGTILMGQQPFLTVTCYKEGHLNATGQRGAPTMFNAFSLPQEYQASKKEFTGGLLLLNLMVKSIVVSILGMGI